MVEIGPADWVALAGCAADPVTVLDSDLSTISRAADKVLRIRDDPPQLYDIQGDPGETRDLALAHPEIVQRLRERWDQWNAQLQPPAWGRPNLPPWF